jgi:hypothetical protein
VKRGAILAALLLAGTRVAPAQSGADLLRQAVRSYQDLNLDDAAGLIRRALDFQGTAALTRADRAAALMYLTTVEVLRSRRDSAAAAARRLVLHDPGYRPDELVFPPPAIALFTTVRRATPAVIARAPADTVIRPGTEALPLRLKASAFHQVRAAVARDDGRLLRTLYAGPIGDSLDLRWDGTDSSGAVVARGRYAVTVISIDSLGRVVRQLRLVLDVAPVQPDTQPIPVRPAATLLKPERTPFGPAWKALAPGALVAAAAAVVPSVVAGGEDHARGRLFISGAVTVAGIAAFLSHHPGRAIPENIAANRRLIGAWAQDSARTAADNVRRKRDLRLQVHAGTALIITPEGP